MGLSVVTYVASGVYLLYYYHRLKREILVISRQDLAKQLAS